MKELLQRNGTKLGHVEVENTRGGPKMSEELVKAPKQPY